MQFDPVQPVQDASDPQEREPRRKASDRQSNIHRGARLTVFKSRHDSANQPNGDKDSAGNPQGHGYPWRFDVAHFAPAQEFNTTRARLATGLRRPEAPRRATCYLNAMPRRRIDWSWLGFLRVIPFCLAIATGPASVLRDGMFLNRESTRAASRAMGLAEDMPRVFGGDCVDSTAQAHQCP